MPRPARAVTLQCPAVFDVCAFGDARGSRRFGGSAGLRAALSRTPSAVRLSGPSGPAPGGAAGATASSDEDGDSSPTVPTAPGAEPIVVLAPGDRAWTAGAGRAWRDRLRVFGLCVPCADDSGDTPGLVRTLVRRIGDLRTRWPGRAIVLAGMSVGCKVAVLAALRVPVEGVLCFGPHVQGSAASLLEYFVWPCAHTQPRQPARAAAACVPAVRSRRQPAAIMPEGLCGAGGRRPCEWGLCAMLW